MSHNVPIDILKGLAIISVILIHSWDKSFLLQIGAPYHIWQAVPIFIILAAYNNINSYNKHNKITFIIRRFNRLVWPYSATIVVETLYIFFINSCMFLDVFAKVGHLINITNNLTYLDVVKMYSYPNLFLFFVTGGDGPGSYFVPVMVQLILTLPLLCLLYRRNIALMVVVAFLLNIVFEVYAFVSDMPNHIYRLLYIRYLFAAALGIWLTIGIDRRLLAVGSIISAIYITSVNYFGVVPPVQPDWGSQNAPSFMLPLLIVIIGLYILPKTVGNIITSIFVTIGKASYHIYLVQMVYFWSMLGHIINKMQLGFVINIIICILIGLMFYYTSSTLRFSRSTPSDST